jgi:hypothetical protein
MAVPVHLASAVSAPARAGLATLLKQLLACFGKQLLPKTRVDRP